MEQLIFHQTHSSELKAFIVEAVEEQFKKYQSNRPKEPEEILNRKETSKYFGCSLPTLNGYTKQGIIKAYRIGNKVRYKKSDVEAALIEIETSKSK